MPSKKDTPSKPNAVTSAVPTGRLSRFTKFGLLTTSIAGSMLVNGAKQFASGKRPKFSDLLLTPSNAKRVVQQLAQMRGAAMKLGQLLSMDAGDLIPPELTNILSTLRADASAMPKSQVEQVLLSQWGKAWKSKVKSFDFDPVAAASIGQVHRATSKKGEALAIKLQYPGVRKSIDSDVDNVAGLLKFSGLVPSDINLAPFLKDAKKQLHHEADYLREGKFLQQFHDLLKDDPSFCVPQWFESLSSADLLAMSYIESIPIEEVISKPQAERDAVIASLIKLFLRELLEFPSTKQLVLLDFGAVTEYSLATVAQFKKLIKSALTHDKARMTAAAQSLGYFDGTTAQHNQDKVMRIIEIALEPQCFDGEFDFSAADLAPRLNELAFDLMKARDFWHVPPTSLLLLQRKAAGIFLLAVKLQARVNVNKLTRQAIGVA
jgi:predicted unusual protein kinase regulating ubiquinone biosynthesis (AarF/ABC1/UbiB family)